MQLRSPVAVAVVEASSYSSDSTPGLGTSICHECGPKNRKKKKRKKEIIHPVLGLTEIQIHFLFLSFLFFFFSP